MAQCRYSGTGTEEEEKKKRMKKMKKKKKKKKKNYPHLARKAILGRCSAGIGTARSLAVQLRTCECKISGSDAEED